jgi:hypothetical protein
MVHFHVNGEQLDWLDGSLHCHTVDLSADHFDVVGKHEVQIARDKQRHTELLGGSFQSGSHIHVGGKVGRVNFEERPDGTLNSPALMQPEAHLHFVARHSCVQSLVISVFEKMTQFVDFGNDFQEGEQGQVSNYLIFWRNFKSS